MDLEGSAARNVISPMYNVYRACLVSVSASGCMRLISFSLVVSLPSDEIKLRPVPPSGVITVHSIGWNEGGHMCCVYV